jgi:hypothetical protein
MARKVLVTRLGKSAVEGMNSSRGHFFAGFRGLLVFAARPRDTHGAECFEQAISES